MDARSSDELYGYDVLDSQGNRFGTVHDLWSDDSGRAPEFIGVKGGFLGSTTYVIPLAQAQVDAANHAIRLPYEQDRIKSAPELSGSDELTAGDESALYRYYGVNQGAPATRSGSYAGVAPAAGSGSYAGVAPAAGSGNYAGVAPAAGSGNYAGVAPAVAAPTAAATATRTAASDIRATEATGQAPAHAAGQREMNVPIAEEQLRVGKQATEAGHVRIRKIVRTETVSVPVELRREDVRVERIPASGTATTDNAFREGVIDIPVMREEAVVQKEAHVVGQVRVQKTMETEHQTVQDQVRKEDVVVDRDGQSTSVSQDAADRQRTRELTDAERAAMQRDRTDRTG